MPYAGPPDRADMKPQAWPYQKKGQEGRKDRTGSLSLVKNFLSYLYLVWKTSFIIQNLACCSPIIGSTKHRIVFTGRKAAFKFRQICLYKKRSNINCSVRSLFYVVDVLRVKIREPDL